MPFSFQRGRGDTKRASVRAQRGGGGDSDRSASTKEARTSGPDGALLLLDGAAACGLPAPGDLSR